VAHDPLHDLTPAYALDALDAEERAAYEQHLSTCEHCRAELETMQRTASSLAYAVVSPAPPPELRGRIVEQARLERGNVVAFRPRRTLSYALGAAAAVAASVAVAVGLWAASLSNELDRQRSVLEILADPQARSLAMTGGDGRLVVTGSGEAALVVSGLAAAPEGKTYEIWVIEGDRALPAGLFDGSEARDVVRLTRPVPRRAAVAVTIEAAGGVDAPTSEPVLSTRS
jgi:anti-sigma-K factor RskA